MRGSNPKEAQMPHDGPYTIWITTRKITPGTLGAFREAWRPREFPDGMLRAFEGDGADRSDIVGIAIFQSRESLDKYRLSEVEAERREAMAPYVESENSVVYDGRELAIPRS
jgi:hypothetical protein